MKKNNKDIIKIILLIGIISINCLIFTYCPVFYPVVISTISFYCIFCILSNNIASYLTKKENIKKDINMDKEISQKINNIMIELNNNIPDDDQKLVINKNKTIEDMNNDLDYIKLSLGYILFDLEATRRENCYLKGIIEREE